MGERHPPPLRQGEPRTRMVAYEFTSAFQERVYNPTEFAEIALRMQRVFRSEHALALYENTRRFLLQGETPWIPIETFRTLMGVNDKPYYDEYKYLNARLIKPAMHQVNECSDIQLQLKTKRRSRAVAELKFLVSENPQMALFTESLKQEPAELPSEGKRRLTFALLGLSASPANARNNCYRDHTEEDIIAGARRRGCLDGGQGSHRETIVNPAGVAYKAITEGWKLPEESPAAIRQSSQELEQAQADEERARAETRRESLRGEFRRSWYSNFIETAPPEELDPLKEAFRESLSGETGDKLVLDRLSKYGISGLVLGVFQHFLAVRGIEPNEDEFEAYLREKASSTEKGA